MFCKGGGHCVQKDGGVCDWHLRSKAIDYLHYAANKSRVTKVEGSFVSTRPSPTCGAACRHLPCPYRGGLL
jgi:hypothetical protein